MAIDLTASGIDSVTFATQNPTPTMARPIAVLIQSGQDMTLADILRVFLRAEVIR